MLTIAILFVPLGLPFCRNISILLLARPIPSLDIRVLNNKQRPSDMLSTVNLPSIIQEDGLARYLQEIQKIPMLSAEEEYALAKRCQEHADIKAAHRLVTSHLKLVAKIAMKFRSYGLPLIDLISEGNIGLMHAVKKFDPDLGYRLSTYAMWWIKASIQDYVLRSWSLVKIGTSAIQKKLFFNLKKVREKISAAQGHTTSYNIDSADISKELGVSKKQIDAIEANISSSVVSLNSYAYDDNHEIEIMDTIASEDESQEDIIIKKYDNKSKSSSLSLALNTLTEREKDIIVGRHLRDKPVTLEMLSSKYSVSRERIRQIEERALTKLKSYMERSYGLLPTVR